MNILNIDACVRVDSRTRLLTDYLLQKFDDEVEVLRLADANIAPLNLETLSLRDSLINKHDFNHPMFDYARQFANADIIVISAPFWDLSFPALLKTYFEYINVLKLVFDYSAQGFPISLCKVKHVYYITTTGGLNLPDEYGFGYIKAFFTTFCGIKDVKYIKAEGLDIIGVDVVGILENAKRNIDKLFL